MTKANFPRLTIQQFCSLFKVFKIYPVKMVEEFLGFYVIQLGMKINNPTWQIFISEIISRWCGARDHYFLLNFLKNVSNSYFTEGRQSEFVVDLLQLKVPNLFAVEECDDELAESEDLEVARRFSLFLRDYINSHALKNSILSQMSIIMVQNSVCICVGGRGGFINVLKSSLAYEFRWLLLCMAYLQLIVVPFLPCVHAQG